MLEVLLPGEPQGTLDVRFPPLGGVDHSGQSGPEQEDRFYRGQLGTNRAVRRAAPSSRLPRYFFSLLSTQAFLSELSASVDARYCTCSARKTPFTTSKTSRCN